MSFEDVIDQVKERPQLWQRSHPLYKNKMLRLKIWKQISKQLNLDEQQLKKSWKYLSDQYRREYKKVSSQALYEGKPAPCGWAYYDRLSFLMPEMVMTRDRRPARIPASSDSETANDSAMAQDSLFASHEAFQEENDASSYYENVIYNATAKQAKQAHSSRRSSITKADLILQRLQNLNATVARCQSEAVTNDEDYMFFMSILPMVRNLTPVRKLQLRGKINEWLLQALSIEIDPLNNVSQHMEQPESCEDNKETVMKQIMANEDDD